MSDQFFHPDQEGPPRKLHTSEAEPSAEICSRCGGLLVLDTCFDLQNNDGQINIVVKKCIQCGNVVDPTILKNRLASDSAAPGNLSRRRWPNPSALSPSQPMSV